jgi:2-keto-4-pentenoate hydratase
VKAASRVAPEADHDALGLRPGRSEGGFAAPASGRTKNSESWASSASAINVAARLGVAGEEVPLQATPETVKTLADARIVASDASGATLAESTGAATLGNPLNAVVWLVEDLAKAGRKLAAGDLISVGSFTPLTPPKAGQAISVRYEGLPGTPKVSLTFE